MYMVNHERIAQEMYDEIVICYNVSTVGQYCSCLPKKKKFGSEQPFSDCISATAENST